MISVADRRRFLCRFYDFRKYGTIRQEARRLAQADAEALIRDHGAAAYREARERERDVILTDGTKRMAIPIARLLLPGYPPGDDEVGSAA